MDKYNKKNKEKFDSIINKLYNFVDLTLPELDFLKDISNSLQEILSFKFYNQIYNLLEMRFALEELNKNYDIPEPIKTYIYNILTNGQIENIKK